MAAIKRKRKREGMMGSDRNKMGKRQRKRRRNALWGNGDSEGATMSGKIEM